MVSDWMPVRLGQLIEITHGYAFPGDGISDEPKSDLLLTPGNFRIGGGFKGDKFKYFCGDVPEDYVLHKGDLVVTMTDLSKESDTLGYPAQVPAIDGGRFLHNQRIGKVLIKDELSLDKTFLYYLFHTIDYRNEVLASATGTSIKHTSPKRILAYKALLPPKSEQLHIARILRALDDKIELNRNVIETLEAMARSIFQSWFVDFDPVRANVEGWVAYLPADIKGLFPDGFADSTPTIPHGWNSASLGNLCKAIYSGGTPSTTVPDYWGGDLPWLSSGETRQTFVTATERTITKKGVDESSTRLARAGTTVIASAGQGNTRGQTSMLLLDAYINQSVVALVADEGKVSDFYLFFALERRYEEFRRVSDGHSSRGSLTTKLLGGLQIVIPPVELVRAFDRVVEPMVRRIADSLYERETLRALRDALIPKLLSGDLRLSDTEGEA